MRILRKSVFVIIILILVSSLISQENRKPPNLPKPRQKSQTQQPTVNRVAIKHSIWTSNKDGIHVRFSEISDKYKVEDMTFPTLKEFLDYTYQLPPSILNELTTEQLFLFCAEQPCMLFSFDLSWDKYFIPLQSFNGYQELIRRPGYLDDLSMLAERYANDDSKANEFCYIMSFFYKESVYAQLTNTHKICIYKALLHRVKLLGNQNQYYFQVPGYVMMFLTAYGKQNDVDIPGSLRFKNHMEALCTQPNEVVSDFEEWFGLMDYYITQMITNLSK